MNALLTLDEALALVLARAPELPLEEVPVREAVGRVLGRAARAASDLPPFPSSAMDGYAVRAADTPGTLAIVGHAAAGSPSEREVAVGEAVAISTGAVVPPGADAVVPVELTRAAADARVAVESVANGANIRPRAGDVRAGDVVLAAGATLGPLQVGALAAGGLASVGCRRRPRVAVLATGSELREPGSELAPGQIYESNSVALAAQARSEGAVTSVLDAVGDDEHATRTALERALADHDVLITSGGVSVGPHDLVRGELARLGVEEVFWRAAVKPGKPIAFGMRGATLVFGLPGNPVSSMVGFELFVRPALRVLQGATEPGPSYLPGVLACAVRRDPARDQLLRARADRSGDAVELEPLSGQESHMIVRASAASALVLIPRGNGELAAGAPVRYLPV